LWKKNDADTGRKRSETESLKKLYYLEHGGSRFFRNVSNNVSD
jgi:hypothetical protein